MFLSKLASVSLAGILIGAGITSHSAEALLPPIKIEEMVRGFDRPVGMIQHPANASVQFIIEQWTGKIRILQNGVIREVDFLDIGHLIPAFGSQGLLGLAFPSDYQTSGVFYINYINLQNDTHVSRWKRDANDPFKADPDSEEVILVIDRNSRIHNGGHIEFGPDGMLYITTGDGAYIELNRAQDPDDLLGKILRIDVSTETGYAIPADNPFVDDDPIDALEEIWSFGWRNPWSFTFDKPEMGGTGAMLIADVGDLNREEFNYEPAGAGGRNYGWRNREGTADRDQSDPPAYEPLTEPVYDYAHNGNPAAIMSGYIYRGTKLGAEFYGRYFFLDMPSRRLWSAGLNIDQNGEATLADLVEHTEEFGNWGSSPAFGMDADGELYIVSMNGRIYEILPDPHADLLTAVVTLGVLLDGGVAEVESSDDTYMHTLSGFGETLVDLHSMELSILAEYQAGIPTTLELRIESRIDEPSGLAQVSMKNFNTTNFDVVGSFPIGKTDDIGVISGLDASKYYNANNGRMRIKIKHLVFVPFLAFTFESFVDQVVIAVD